MKKLSAIDKKALLDNLNGTMLYEVGNTSYRYEGIKLPEIGNVELDIQILSSNHLLLKGVYSVKQGTFDYEEYDECYTAEEYYESNKEDILKCMQTYEKYFEKIDIEELEGKMFFYISGEYERDNTLFRYEEDYRYETESGEEYSSIFFVEKNYSSLSGIYVYDSMTCEMKEGSPSIAKEDLDGKFYQRIGHFCYEGECFYHHGKWKITPEEYHEALKGILLEQPIKVEKGYFKWDIDDDRMEYSGYDDYFLSWKDGKIVYTLINDFIEVKINNKYFFLGKPNNMYLKKVSYKNIMIFRSECEIEKI